LIGLRGEDREKIEDIEEQLLVQWGQLDDEVLVLLAVFASKSDQNRMPSANLSAIFQPGMLSHPQHDMSPEEYKLSQDVLIFLIVQWGQLDDEVLVCLDRLCVIELIGIGCILAF
jgi:hypothetical protein